MSDAVGNMSYYDSSGQTEYGFTKPYSEKTAELIDTEAKKIVEQSYNKAKEVISANIDGLKQLAEQLLEKEVIFSEDLERIFGKRKGDHSRDLTDDKHLPEIPATPEVTADTESPVTPASPAASENIETPGAPESQAGHGE
jgi:cell division protease FtsH